MEQANSKLYSGYRYVNSFLSYGEDEAISGVFRSKDNRINMGMRVDVSNNSFIWCNRSTRISGYSILGKWPGDSRLIDFPGFFRNQENDNFATAITSAAASAEAFLVPSLSHSAA